MTRSQRTFDLQNEHRLAVLKSLLVVTMLGGALFFAVNMQRGQYLLGFAELTMGLGAVAIYPVISRTAHLTRWTLVFLVPFYAVLMLALAMPGTTPSIFVWVFIIPILSYLLLGRRLGLPLTLGLLACASAIYVVRHGLGHETITPTAMLNVLLCAIAILAFSHVYERRREASEYRLMVLARTDALTGLGNVTHFREAFEHELAQARAQASPLSLLLLDLDHFKSVNDRFGHRAGDILLEQISERLQRRLRASDRVYRVGGEEFCVLLPATDRVQAVALAEQLRSFLAETEFSPEGETIPVSVSIGVAQLDRDGASLDALYHAADGRLYSAKAQGRNRVSPDPDELAAA